MSYFKVQDAQVKSTFNIYPFTNVESIYIDIQEEEYYVSVSFKNKDRIVTSKEQYDRYIDWL